MSNKGKYSMKLIIGIVIIFSLILSIGTFLFIVQKPITNLNIEEVTANNDEIAESAVLYFESKIEEQISIIRVIEVAHHKAVQNTELLDLAFYTSILEQNPYLQTLELFNNDGIILYSSIENENRVGLNISGNSVVEMIEDFHQLYIGSLIYNSNLEELTLEVVYSGEEMNVISTISVEYFQVYGDEFKVSFDNKEIMILDDEGKYLYDSYGENHLIRARYPHHEEILEHSVSGDSAFIKINGIDSIASIKQLNITPGYIVIYETADSALSLGSLTSLYYTISASIIFLFILVTFGILGFIFILEMNLIVKSFTKGSKGDFDSKLEQSNITEFNLIRQSFNQSRDSLKDMTNKLEYLAYHDSLTNLPTRNRAKEDFDTFDKANQYAFLYFASLSLMKTTVLVLEILP